MRALAAAAPAPVALERPRETPGRRRRTRPPSRAPGAPRSRARPAARPAPRPRRPSDRSSAACAASTETIGSAATEASPPATARTMASIGLGSARRSGGTTVVGSRGSPSVSTPGGRSVRVEDAHARGWSQRAGDHAMTAIRDGHVRPEALPGAPLLRSPRQDPRAVDPHRHRALHRDDELALAARREERLDVEDAVVRLLVRLREAPALRRREDVRHGAAQGIRRPRGRPRGGPLRRKGAHGIGCASVTEGPRDVDSSRAAHAREDVLVVGLGRLLGVRVDLGRAPVLELRDRSPAEMTGPREQGIERGAVLREEVRDRSAKRQELARREPGERAAPAVPCRPRRPPARRRRPRTRTAGPRGPRR